MEKRDELEALKGAMFHLRMVLAGRSSYSGTPSKVDKGWAELVMDRLDGEGYMLVKKHQS